MSYNLRNPFQLINVFCPPEIIMKDHDFAPPKISRFSVTP